MTCHVCGRWLFYDSERAGVCFACIAMGVCRWQWLEQLSPSWFARAPKWQPSLRAVFRNQGGNIGPRVDTASLLTVGARHGQAG